MDKDFVLTVRISRKDLIEALEHSTTIKAGDYIDALKVPQAMKGPKATKAPKPAPEPETGDEEFDEDEDVKPAKPAKKTKAKPAPVAPPVEDDDEESEEEEESDEEAEEEEENDGDDEEFITGEDLAKLKKALNAHKAAQGGKPKKTLEILRKFAPGGSEKVKPDVLPKLLKALKV